MKYLFLFLSLFLLKFSISAQSLPLSEQADFSLITVGPGNYLYDKFGHSALRVNDPANDRDWVFNYGTYDFSTPNFYTKFAQGKLLYSLDIRPFEQFNQSYVRQNRWLKEQFLNLNYEEKQSLLEFLITNAQPENKSYKYDFFYDNCATRIRDGLVSTFPQNVDFPDTFIEENKTFRQLIQENVQANSWGSLGMDVAIGSVTDITASAWQHQYLPFYLFDAFSVATIQRNGKAVPLVTETKQLFSAKPKETQTSFFTSPLFVFGLISLLILWITYRDYTHHKRSRFLDGILFALTGIIGIFLLLLWFATDHSATANNYNLLWAFPFSVLFCFAISKKQPKAWVHRYVIFLIVLMGLLTLHSITGVQAFAIGFTPLFIAIAVRYFYVAYFLKRQLT